MKKISVLVIAVLIISVSLCQGQYPGMQNVISKNITDNDPMYYLNVSALQLDSNDQYKFVRDGFILQGGQLKLARNGHLYLQDSPVTLKNGAIILTDGLIKMTNGSTPLLRENDFIDMDGNIRPLQKRTNYY
jgi:hypothetical protein